MNAMLQQLLALRVAKKLEETIGQWVESLQAPRAVALERSEPFRKLQRINSARALRRATQLRETFQGLSHANEDMQEALRRYKLRRELFDQSPQQPMGAGASGGAPPVWDGL